MPAGSLKTSQNRIHRPWLNVSDVNELQRKRQATYGMVKGGDLKVWKGKSTAEVFTPRGFGEIWDTLREGHWASDIFAIACHNVF